LQEYLAVGKVLSSWSFKGQVKIQPLTDDIMRFKKLKKVFLQTDDKKIPHEVESVTFLNNRFVVLKIKGIDSERKAKELISKYVFIHRDDAVKLPEGRYFICDIIGLDVFTEQEEYIGKITDVLETGANDVYVVKRVGKADVLLPAIKQVIKVIDIHNRKMIVRPMEGLL
jgi:16S rRNA processing protein RimM